MRQTRFSLDLKHELDATQINKRQKYTTKRITKLLSILTELNDNLNTLLEHCFGSMLPHVWHRIIPSIPSVVNPMAFTMSQTWYLIGRLLLYWNIYFNIKKKCF